MTAKMARIYIPGVGDSEIRLEGGTPYNQDSVQKYPLGSIITMGLRKFAYAKAYGTLNSDLGAKIGSHQHMAYTTVAASADAGVSSITADFGATDGAAHDGVVAADELVGGFIVFFPHSENSFVREIVGNTAVGSGGGEITIELDSPTPVAIVVDVTHCEAMASPFLNVVSGTSGDTSVVGIPTYPATTGKYCWLQIAGPCWVAPQGEVGDAAHDQQIVFRHDGSIDEHDYSDGNVAKQQHCGFVLSRAYGGTQGAPFVNLQIWS